MLTVTRLDQADARLLLAGAAARARAIGVPMCIAVTDESGNLLAFERMDGGKVTSVTIAQDKAFTAAAARKATHDYNAACQPGEFNPAELDGLHTEGIDPPKSNWALPLTEPPFFGVAVTCGITFTFGGLRITPQAEVLGNDYRPIGGLYAAGECTGGLFYHNYPGGTGLMNGAVFGRIAGGNAGRHATG